MEVVKSIFLVLCVLSLSNSRRCREPKGLVDIDWSLMGGHWYDVIDIRTVFPRIVCWDWVNITAHESGFTGSVEQRMPEKPGANAFMRDLRLVGEHTYAVLNDSKDEYIEASIKSLNHLEHLRLQVIKRRANYTYSWEWFFVTDYDNYFILINCLKSGWQVFVKSRSPRIDSNDVINISNMLNRHGICAQMVMKTECMDIYDQLYK